MPITYASTNIPSPLPVAQGGTGTTTTCTQGSVVFAGPNGVYIQNNSKLFFDNTNFRLGIGTASPSAALHIAVSGGTNPILAGAIGDATTYEAIVFGGSIATTAGLLGMFASGGGDT